MTKTQQKAFHLPVDLDRRLKRLVARTRRSQAQEMILAIERHLDAEERPNAEPTSE